MLPGSVRAVVPPVPRPGTFGRMGGVAVTDWDAVLAGGLHVPEGRPLAELTAELTMMLGDPDPGLRDETALPTLATWIERGVYDDLLVGLGDGMAAGLGAGLGENGTDTVFRRSFSALVLAQCLARGVERDDVSRETVLGWGDQLVTWLLREQDLRGFVDGKGWAHALAHGADAVGVLATSAHLGPPELTVLLDVVADRVLLPGFPVAHGEPDRCALAVLEVLRRDALPLAVLEPWVERLAAGARAPVEEHDDPATVRGGPEAFLRACYLHLVLTPRPPAVRTDLLLVLVEALRGTNADLLG